MAESDYVSTGTVLSIGRSSLATKDYWTKAFFVNGKETRLIYGLRVELLELRKTPAKKTRQYFKILEGFYKNKKAYVGYPYTKSTLVTPPRYKPPVKIVFDLDKQSMTINGGVAFNAFSGSVTKNNKVYTQLKRGSHKIAIPNYPHGAASEDTLDGVNQQNQKLELIATAMNQMSSRYMKLQIMQQVLLKQLEMPIRNQIMVAL